MVSHDRFFLDNVANKIWFIENQEIKQYPGTYAEFDVWYAKRKLEAKSNPTPAALPKKEEKKEPAQTQPANHGKPVSDNKHQQLKKLNQDLSKMEEQMNELEKTIRQLETSLADDKLYNNAAQLKDVNNNYQQKKLELGAVQQKWDALAEQIMELEA